MAFGDERSRIAHLLRRAGFGASQSELDTAVANGYDATLDQLLNPQDDHDAAEDVLSQSQFDFSKYDDLQRWWLLRMRYTSRPLVEKMTLYWHGHLTSAASKVGGKALPLMKQQNDLFRAQGLGSFHDLILNISKDPAMLIWLDGRQNHKSAPNENYGRELMELFTLGIGNYTEDDVKAAARAFTGWGLDQTMQFIFRPADHDASQKTFLGQTGAFNGDDVINIILQQPVAPTFLATKLARFFVSDPPDAGLVGDLASNLLSTNWDLKSTMHLLFKSDAFASQAAYHALIKSPTEFVVGSLRSLGVQTNGQGMTLLTRLMGQDLFNPPNVAGWPGGPAWISTNTMLARDNMANSLATAAKPGSGFYVDPKSLANLPAGPTVTDVVNSLATLTVDGDLSSDELARLTQYVGADPASTFDFSTQALQARGLLYLLLTTPEYSLN
jgi:uncharacterized protein (DUF1800 family)